LVFKKDFRIGVSLKAEARYRASAFNDTIGELASWRIGELLALQLERSGILQGCALKSVAAIDKLRQLRQLRQRKAERV
jgi:hypothetical protein